MAIHNVTDSALLVKKSRRTIQRYIAQGKISVTRDSLGNPQIDTTELMRVFGSLSQVAQKKVSRKSQDVALDLSQQKEPSIPGVVITPEIATLIADEVAKGVSKAIAPLIDKIENLTNRLDHKPMSAASENIQDLSRTYPVSKDNYLDDIPTFGKR